MDPLLRSRLRPLDRRRRWLILGWQLALAAGAAAAIAGGFILLYRQSGWSSAFTVPALAGLTASLVLALVLRQSSAATNYRHLAQQVEMRHPELQGVLLTAVQQSVSSGQSPSYLQRRVVEDALRQSDAGDWAGVVPGWKVGAVSALTIASVVLLVAALAQLVHADRQGPHAWNAPWGVTVTPGDAQLERGETLVVLARFGGALPADVTLVLRRSGAVPRTLSLVKSLADPVFGASVPEVDQPFSYHLEYSGQSTREYHVGVFEHPRLEQANVAVTYPAYTGLSPRRIEKTRRVSAVVGSRLDWTLQLNKPVASAAFIAHDAKKTAIPLQVAGTQATASLTDFPLVASQTYDLRLVDAEGRANPLATPFVFEALPDRPPELHVSSPRGDLRPSPVEEITFAGTVFGDYGLASYGITYAIAGGTAHVIELGKSVPAMAKQSFSSTLRLEDLGVQPDQLLSWYVWAEDRGPDGHPRRTPGDLFFAEIRPFDEIYRESSAMPGGADAAGGSDGQEDESQHLVDLQKQVVSATWKLQRDPTTPHYPDDADVVRAAEAEALAQAGTARQKAEDPRAQALWHAVAVAMQQALTHLQGAAKHPPELAPALSAEESAYEALLRLQAHETQVAQGRRGGSGRGGASQRQLDQLELTQEQNRYETQKEASAAPSPERREQLQVMNRLQELARRQQDVNDRLKELQTALQEARSEPEREDVRRQLKRLQDEQQQLVADVDELRQRLDRQTNQSALSDQRRQLEQTRSDVQRAADAAGQGAPAEALAAGTRAQRQFQEMHDAVHQLNSNQFSDDLRALRAQARALADQEEAIAQKLNGAGAGAPQKRLSDDPGGDSPLPALAQQKQRLTDLVNRAKQVSEQAETSEPLLAEKLYDSLRKLGQDDAGTAREFQQELLNNGLLSRALNDRLSDPNAPEGTKTLDLTSSLVQDGYRTQASAAEQRARAGIDALKSGVERAAESVIGDDASALRLARAELDAVANQLKGAADSPETGNKSSAAPGPPPGAGKSGAGSPAALTQNPPAAPGAAAGSAGRSSPAGTPGTPASAGNPGSDPSGTAAGASAAAESLAGAPSAGPAAGPRSAPSPGGPPRLTGASPASPHPGGTGMSPSGSGAAEEAGASDRTGGNPLLAGANAGGGRGAADPITGDGYGAWSDRLREVEEIVDAPDLRNTVATARERARLLRQDYKRTLKRPDWAVIQKEVVAPLIEVRDHLSDELARRGAKDSLVPIDRDPVPNRYAESVRKYYEALGKDK